MDKHNEYKVTKYACYITSISLSIVTCLSPLLFLTFREMYNVSFTLLGLLVAVNFLTQLSVDLVFSFFSHKFNIDKTVQYMPFITFVGFIIYAVLPLLIPSAAYLWILIGTIVFSVSAGLTEVLTSPVIAAIPSDNTEREISKLHSMYAWGQVGAVILGALFLTVFGTHNWAYLSLFYSIVPLTAFIMFKKSKIPDIQTHNENNKNKKNLNTGLILSVVCIFFAGASELTMAQWSSSFIESAIGIPKLWGDILGVAAFSALLGLGRTLYTKYGKNIVNTMIFGIAGATVCYFVAGISLNPVIGILACVITGLCVSMLWPGILIYVDEKKSGAGVAVYAMLAAGGDLGASVGPQLLGIISDKVSVSAFALKISEILNITLEQIGLRAGLLIITTFPLLGLFFMIILRMYYNMNKVNR